MGYAVQGHPRRTGHSGEFRLNAIHLEQELASHCRIFAKKTPLDRNKRLNDMTLENHPLRSEGIQHATEEEWRTSASSSRAKEVVGRKPKRR